RHIGKAYAVNAAVVVILALASASLTVQPSEAVAAYVPSPLQEFDDPFQDLDRSAERFVNREVARSTALYFTCFGIYLLVGLIFLIYWRWMRRDLPVLAVALIALLMAVHTAAVSGSLTYIVPEILGAEGGAMLELISYLLLNGFIAFMLWTFFPDSFIPIRTSWMHVINSGITAVAGVSSIAFAVGALAFGAEFAVYALSISRWLTILVMVVVTVLVLLTLERHEPFFIVTSISLSLIIVGSIHDVLFAGGGEDARPYLITFAFLGFILLQSYVVIRRSIESTRMARVSRRQIAREVEERTRELRATTVASEAANIAKTEFVTSVTHELRTPLTSMIGYTQLLQEELKGHLDARQLEFFESLRVSGERLLNLVNNLLDLARIEAGRVALNLSDVPVQRVVEEVRGQMFPLATEKNLYIKTTYHLQDGMVRADGARLRDVLVNLVSNAVKFTSTGGVTISVSAEPDDPDTIAVSVADTGSGISEQFMPHLFDRFAREERGTDSGPMGSGLGLTIARELVTRMGGRIAVDSRMGAGSTFTVLLPAA
ncbi:MAG: ATP-binding protein, partial [Rhodothermales bacterium]